MKLSQNIKYFKNGLRKIIICIKDHPNIIKLYEVYEDEDFLYFMMDFCREELFDRILSSVTFSEKNSS